MSKEAPQRKLRSSCDRCGAAKLRCDRSQPECTRCLSVGIACVYGVSRKAGKPPRKRDRQNDNNGHGSTGSSVCDNIISSSGSVSSLMDGYPNNLMTSVHVADAFRDTPIDLSLPELNVLFGFDDHLSTSQPVSTLGSPELEHYTFPAEQTKNNASRTHVDENIYFHNEYLLPISSKDHNCSKEAYDILGGLSLLNPNHASTPPSATDSTSSTVNSLPLDHILRLNRESSEQLGCLLACPCARYPHLALLYASIISRIMIWYEQAAGGFQRDSWSPKTAVAEPPGSCHLSPSGYVSGLSSWSGSAVNTGGVSTPLTEDTAIAVTSARMSMGSFDIDDKQVQSAMRIQLLIGEIRRTSHLIQLFASRGASDLDEHGFDGVEGLYQSLSSWLRMEHARITDLIQSQLKKVNS